LILLAGITVGEEFIRPDRVLEKQGELAQNSAHEENPNARIEIEPRTAVVSQNIASSLCEPTDLLAAHCSLFDKLALVIARTAKFAAPRRFRLS
jgi:hypothetical protein